MWNKFPNTPPDIPETEDFGIDYEVKYKLPNGKIETTITEWLLEKMELYLSGYCMERILSYYSI
ncbi:MAG: hypothetical protein ACLT4F_09205 [Clostridia bacterium]